MAVENKIEQEIGWLKPNYAILFASDISLFVLGLPKSNENHFICFNTFSDFGDFHYIFPFQDKRNILSFVEKAGGK